MSIDLEQFIPTFIEESLEGLELMESRLLNLEQSDDPDELNAIFRAAHSIKGGAGTFGFSEISDYTHLAETLLDEMRAGIRPVTSDVTEALLQSADCIRLMLESLDGLGDEATGKIEASKARMQQLLDGGAGSAHSTDDNSDTLTPAMEGGSSEGDGSAAGPSGFHITFIPEPHLLQTGNDPAFLIDALRSLGELHVDEVSGHWPESLAEFDPESCYLRWQMRLFSECAESDIREIFEWVEDDCALIITPLDNTHADAVVAADDTSEEASHSAPTEKQEVSEAPVAEITDNSASVPSAAVAVNNTTPETVVKSDIEEGKAPAAAATKSASPAKGKSAEAASSIRVGIDKIDALINRVGELVITQSMLGQVSFEMSDVNHPAMEKLIANLSLLERNMRDLQEEVMRIRMMPIASIFNRFPRLVHDVSKQLGKQVELVIFGEQTELDKTVLEKIGDPLVHLIRNSLDHGLEPTEERIALGKPEMGTVSLSASQQGGHILIEVTDDGRGLNPQKLRSKAIEKGLISEEQNLTDDDLRQLIFMPGFSTAAKLSDISGRGVGMDVVRRNIESLGGDISIHSQIGKGTTLSIRLPLTLAILDGQLIRVGDQIYIIPLVSIVESIQLRQADINKIAGSRCLYQFRQDYIPLVDIQRFFGNTGIEESAKPLLVIVDAGGRKVGLLIDELQSQQQVVVKSLEANFKKVIGVEGATILGDGSVALIIDITSLCREALAQPSLKAVS
ncbi:chemotaxis protein CheA [Pokkaliibacter sp. CJK22405]|uniref:chemotaxis protein CheA n=1 Tax=Pokkaliibacter sp. CJK22405 TaxID=3384615 RepID=UPI003984B0A8